MHPHYFSTVAATGFHASTLPAFAVVYAFYRLKPFGFYNVNIKFVEVGNRILEALHEVEKSEVGTTV